MGRWSDDEERALLFMRVECASELKEVLPFPEVVGDRRLVRFLRGKQGGIEEATSQYRSFLKWRIANGIDSIRNDIASNNLNSPFKFPSGKKILDVLPQYVILSDARDLSGQPIIAEFFGCDVNKLFSTVTMDEYLKYVVYILEYRAMVLEQLSEEEERDYLHSNVDPLARADNYGVVLRLCVLRDLKGVGLQHIGAKGKEMMLRSLEIAIPNYPEYAGKTFFINTPLVFNGIWIFLTKTLLDRNILQKTQVFGTDYIDHLLREIPINCIPVDFGGKYQARNSEFKFDFSPDGPLAMVVARSRKNSSSASLPRSRNNSSGNLQLLNKKGSGSSKEFKELNTPTKITIAYSSEKKNKDGFLTRFNKIMRRASKSFRIKPRKTTVMTDDEDPSNGYFNMQLLEDNYNQHDVLVDSFSGSNSPGTPLASEKVWSRSRSNSNLGGLAYNENILTSNVYMESPRRKYSDDVKLSSNQSKDHMPIDVILLIALSILSGYVLARLFL